MNFYEDEFFKASTFLDRWKHLFNCQIFLLHTLRFASAKGNWDARSQRTLEDFTGP